MLRVCNVLLMINLCVHFVQFMDLVCRYSFGQTLWDISWPWSDGNAAAYKGGASDSPDIFAVAASWADKVCNTLCAVQEKIDTASFGLSSPCSSLCAQLTAGISGNATEASCTTQTAATVPPPPPPPAIDEGSSAIPMETKLIWCK